jgi:hypothetical protein
MIMTVPPASPESMTPAEIAAAVMAANLERQPQLGEFGSFVTPRRSFAKNLWEAVPRSVKP